MKTPSITARKLADELEAFERLRRQLLEGHRDEFVAIHGGEVIDTDPDEFRLAARIEPIAMREGPVAICKVSDAEAEPTDYPCAHFESPIVSEPGP
ncbi:MAG: hypothetical protein ACODAJ_04120 [Planctomycetota bacterium]